MSTKKLESPFISFTELLSSAFFIFVIMILYLALNQGEENQTDATKKKTQTNFLQTIGKQLKASGMNVNVDLKTLSLVFPETVSFLLDSSKIDNVMRGKIKKIAETLEKNLACNIYGMFSSECNSNLPRPSTVLIEGHTDTIGSESHNWALSSNRAYSFLNELYVQSNLLKSAHSINNNKDYGTHLFGIAGYGESRNRVEVGPNKGEQTNRRIEIRFIFSN